MQRLGINGCPTSPSANTASPFSPTKAAAPHARATKAASSRMLSLARSSSTSSSTSSVTADASAASSRLVGYRRRCATSATRLLSFAFPASLTCVDSVDVRVTWVGGGGEGAPQ